MRIIVLFTTVAFQEVLLLVRAQLRAFNEDITTTTGAVVNPYADDMTNRLDT